MMKSLCFGEPNPFDCEVYGASQFYFPPTGCARWLDGAVVGYFPCWK
jgi:hypothetical protein